MYKTKNGLYRKQVTINGVRKVFSGKTQRDVYLKIADYTEAIKKGVLFRDASESWYSDCETRLAYNTLRSYRKHLNNLLPLLGDKPMESITPAEYEKALIDIAHEHSHKGVRHHASVVKQVYKYASLHLGVINDPTKNVDLPKGLPSKIRRYPSDEDIEAITSHADDKGGLLPFFALYTGMRIGEICALQWKDIDFKRKVIHVTKAVVWTPTPVIKPPKTATSIRDVPLMDALATHLHPTAPSDYVFGGIKPVSEHYARHGITDFLNGIGVQVNPHGLRHGFASMLFRQGLDVQSVSRILGHSSTSVTMNIYLHILDTSYMDTARAMLEQIHTTHTLTPENPHK